MGTYLGHRQIQLGGSRLNKMVWVEKKKDESFGIFFLQIKINKSKKIIKGTWNVEEISFLDIFNANCHNLLSPIFEEDIYMRFVENMWPVYVSSFSLFCLWSWGGGNVIKMFTSFCPDFIVYMFEDNCWFL